LATALGVERVVVTGATIDGDALAFAVRPVKAERRRCSRCGARCPGYDSGSGTRRWRALDIGRTPVFIEAAAPRVLCKEHGVVVQRVPWARPGSTFTRAFEEVVAWCVKQTSKTAVAELMRVAWETVGAILDRVVADAKNGRDLLDGLTRIGVDEVSFRKGHRYLTVVVDHGSGRIVWAKEGRDMKTLRTFFDELGAERTARLTHVTADAASWIGDVVVERCPTAVLCIDPYHVVAWANDALDQVRRGIWNDSRKAGERNTAKLVKGARYALVKNPENLTDKQKARLSTVETLNRPLFRAYLLKEMLRLVFATKGDEGIELLARWLAWAQRCRIAPFVKLARSIRRHRQGIEASLRHRMSNGRVEATNNQIRLLTRVAHGFHSATALIALVFLKLGGLPINLPTRPRLSSPTDVL
jgi:transposase